jgi:hypothetical protein
MTLGIGEVLDRRSDLSTFVVHLTRKSAGRSAAQALQSIIRQRRLIARTAMGWASAQDIPHDPSRQSQRVVCFSEVPLEHIYSLVADIVGRRVALEPYGLALTKMKARKLGVNPVWYVDSTPGHDWEVSRALDRLRDKAITGDDFHSQDLAKILPFAEPMGTWSNTSQREFWREREWRHSGDILLAAPTQVTMWLCPEQEMDDFRAQVQSSGCSVGAPFIDPRWGLEKIIAHLAGESDVSPFDPR